MWGEALVAHVARSRWRRKAACPLPITVPKSRDRIRIEIRAAPSPRYSGRYGGDRRYRDRRGHSAHARYHRGAPRQPLGHSRGLVLRRCGGGALHAGARRDGRRAARGRRQVRLCSPRVGRHHGLPRRLVRVTREPRILGSRQGGRDRRIPPNSDRGSWLDPVVRARRVRRILLPAHAGAPRG